MATERKFYFQRFKNKDVYQYLNIVSSYEDTTLYDNAQGFSNFAAPGSDRFKLKDPDFIS